MKNYHSFAGAMAFVTLVGLGIRITELDARPMHADEAVQAARFRELWKDGRYRYDPHEYHGPTLNYLTLPVVWISRPMNFAATTESMYRAVPAVFGVGLIVLMLGLRKEIGSRATAWASLFVAVSPAMVFYSRYYIHETLLVFFTFATVISAWRYWRTGKFAWCLAAGASLGCMQATKETAVLSLASMVAATLATVGLGRLCPSRSAAVSPRRGCDRDADAFTQNATIQIRAWHLVASACVAAVVASLWFSSFLANPRGVVHAALTYLPWTNRATGASPHVHPWYFYLQRLVYWHIAKGPVWSEAPLLALSAIGWAYSLLPRLRKDNAPSDPLFVRWIGFYTLALAITYSAIPYKTPWCLLGFHHTAIVLAGYGVSQLSQTITNRWIAVIWQCVVVTCLVHLTWQTYRTSYSMPSDARNPYVYAQTLPSMQQLSKDLIRISGPAVDGDSITVKVVWHDAYYWPLPWYLRKMRRVGYWDHVPDDPVASFVVASPEHDETLTRELDETHLMTGYYAVRPNVLAQLWVSMEIWEAYLRRIGSIP